MDRRPIASATALAWASGEADCRCRLGGACCRVGRRPTSEAAGSASAWAVAAAGSIGVGAFFLYLWYRLGDPLTHLQAHSAWGRKTGLVGLAASARRASGSPVGVGGFLQATLLVAAVFAREPVVARIGAKRAWYCSPVCWSPRSSAGCSRRVSSLPSRLVDLGPLLRGSDLLVFLLFFGLGLRAWRLRGPFWACLILIPILQGMATGTPLSMKRIVLSCFPAYIEAAELCPRRWGFAAVILGCVVGQVASIDRFVHHLFAG